MLRLAISGTAALVLAACAVGPNAAGRRVVLVATGRTLRRKTELLDGPTTYVLTNPFSLAPVPPGP